MAETGVKPKGARKEYYSIPVNLYQPDELIHRDLYLLYQGEYLLFRPKNLRWNVEDQERLKSFDVSHLFIKCETVEDANAFLESNLARILHEPKIDRTQKAQIIYDTSRSIIEDIFLKPNSSEQLRRSVDFVKNSIDYLKEEEGFYEIMKMASSDFSEYTHALQTSAYAIALARSAGMRTFNELAAIGVGSILHDIGKVKIDARILDKGEHLNPDERREVQKHPQYGFEILRRHRTAPEEAEVIVLQHHERPEGKGYPYGINDELKFSVRVVSLVDCFDSLTSNRTYKKKLSALNAIRLMREDLKDEYDQNLLIEFIKILGIRP